MWVPSELKKLVAYQPGKPIEETKREFGLSEVYKLASNENPLGPNPRVVEACQKVFSELHRYPDGASMDLRKAMAEFYDVEETQLAFGNGSDELISLLMRIYCIGFPKAAVLMPEMSFIAYKIAAKTHQLQVIESPLKPRFEVDVDALIQRWTPETRIIFLANPNNPTGTYLSGADIRKLLDFAESRQTLVVVDEAYYEYARAQDYLSAMSLLPDYKCLAVFRTFSKAYGLAGLRLGALISSNEVIDLVNRIRSPFNLNIFVQAAAMEAIRDQAYVTRSQQVTWEGLDFLTTSLKAMGYDPIPSQANFIFFDAKESGRDLFDRMLRKGMIVRPVGNYGLPNHIRVSVGLKNENEFFLKCLKECRTT